MSTSKTYEIAQNPAFGKPGTYLYQIDGQQVSGVDVNAVYPGNPFPGEQEIIVPGGIPREAIMGAQPILEDGKIGESVINAFYKGGS